MDPSLLSTSAGPAQQAMQTSIDRLIVRLNALCRTVTLHFTLAVGKTVVDEIYGGDAAKWRSKHPRKDLSFRKLTRHPDLPMSAGALSRCISIYELSERIGTRTWKHVCSSHLRLVLPCPPDEQRRLLIAAETNRWTVRVLDENVTRVLADLPKCERRSGRKRQTELRKMVVAVQKCIPILVATLDGWAGEADIAPESSRVAAEALRQAAHLCSALEQRLQRVPSVCPVSGGGE